MKTLPVLFFTLLLDTISIGIIIPVLPSLFTDPSSANFLLTGYSTGTQFFIAGAITAVFGLMQFIAAPILGELSDVYGRKRLLTIGVGVLAFANLLFGFGVEIASITLLFVSRTLAGLAGANFSIAQATIADVSKPEDRAKNFGLIGAAFGVGFILGPLLGGYLTAVFNHAAAPFWAAGLLGIINLVFISVFLPETRKGIREAGKSFTLLKGIHNIRAAMKDKDAGSVYLTSFLYMCGFAFFTSFVSILLAVQYGFSEASVGTFFGMVGFFIVLTQLVILPRIVRHYRERQIIVVGFPVVALCVLLYPFIGTPLLYILVPIMAVPQGLAFANISSLVSKSVSAERQGAALGINGSLMALAQGIVPLIAGVGTGIIGLKAPFVAGAILIMSAWFVIRASNRRILA